MNFCDPPWTKALFSNVSALFQVRSRPAFGNCKRTVTKGEFTKTKQQQKKPQFIYLLVLPKLKISSPTAKEKKTNKQTKSETPPLLKSQNTEGTAVGQVGAENQEGEDGEINSPNT